MTYVGTSKAIVVGNGSVVPPSDGCTPLDSFLRTVASGWGTSTGSPSQTWKQTTGAMPASGSVSPGVGHLYVTGGGGLPGVITEKIPLAVGTPNTFLFKFRMDALAPGMTDADINFAVVPTGEAGVLRTDGSGAAGGPLVAGAYPFIYDGAGLVYGPLIALDPTIFYFVRWTYSGSPALASLLRIWPVGTAEPPGWDLAVTPTVAGVGTAFEVNFEVPNGLPALVQSITADVALLEWKCGVTGANCTAGYDTFTTAAGIAANGSRDWGTTDDGHPWVIDVFNEQPEGLFGDHWGAYVAGGIGFLMPNVTVTGGGGPLLFMVGVTGLGGQQPQFALLRMRFRDQSGGVPSSWFSSQEGLRVWTAAGSSGVNTTSWAFGLAPDFSNPGSALGITCGLDPFPVAASIPLTTSDWFWVRAQMVGSTVSARAWQDGNVEPTTWAAVGFLGDQWNLDGGANLALYLGVNIFQAAASSLGIEMSYFQIDVCNVA